MENRRFPVVDALIQDIEASAEPDWIALATAVLAIAAERGANAYAILDVLIEGIVAAVTSLPADKQTAAATATMRLAVDRLQAAGVG